MFSICVLTLMLACHCPSALSPEPCTFSCFLGGKVIFSQRRPLLENWGKAMPQRNTEIKHRNKFVFRAPSFLSQMFNYGFLPLVLFPAPGILASCLSLLSFGLLKLFISWQFKWVPPLGEAPNYKYTGLVRPVALASATPPGVLCYKSVPLWQLQGLSPASCFGDLLRGPFSSCFWFAGENWFTASLWSRGRRTGAKPNECAILHQQVPTGSAFFPSCCPKSSLQTAAYSAWGKMRVENVGNEVGVGRCRIQSSVSIRKKPAALGKVYLEENRLTFPSFGCR